MSAHTPGCEMKFTDEEFTLIHVALASQSHELRKIALLATTVPAMDWHFGVQEGADKLEKLAERIINESGAF